jgi:hypothetical protein
MDDREHMMEVDSLLEGAWEVEHDLMAEQYMFFDAATALISEAMRDPKFTLRRFDVLSKAMEKPRERLSAAYRKLDKLLNEIQASIGNWKTRDREYRRFRDDTWRIVAGYLDHMNMIRDRTRSVMAEVEVYRRFLTASGR